jgi:hypothetical protein
MNNKINTLIEQLDTTTMRLIICENNKTYTNKNCKHIIPHIYRTGCFLKLIMDQKNVDYHV